jgi:hypothetical protein
MMHDNSLQPANLAQHTVRQVPLHYVVANQREFNPPKILVMLAKYYKKVMNIPTNNV